MSGARPAAGDAARGDAARGPRRLATGLLVAMAGLFVLAGRETGAGAEAGWGWLRAFAEAGMVGGLADWFAVTALFRHPLGLPIPHTALVPANKDRIATSMGSFLRGNFLTPTVVARRMRGLDLAGAIGRTLAQPGGGAEGGSRAGSQAGSQGGGERLRAGVAEALGEVMRALDDERIAGLVRGARRGQLERLDLAPLAGQLLAAAMAEGRHVPLLDAALLRMGEALEENEPLLRAMIERHAGALMRWTGLDSRVANAVLAGLYRVLAECAVDPHHPLRARLEESIAGLAEALVHDPAMRARVAALQAEALANPAMAAWMDGLGARLRAAIHRAATDPEHALGGKLAAGLAGFGEALQSDARLRLTLNRVARRVLVGLTNRHGASIVTLVSETVRRWDGQTVSRRIEAVVGRDLQYIRLNGTLVGGIVGLALHAVQGVL